MTRPITKEVSFTLSYSFLTIGDTGPIYLGEGGKGGGGGGGGVVGGDRVLLD